jgi:hypothetical protein
MEDALHRIHDDLESGTYGRPQAVLMLCGMYEQRDQAKGYAWGPSRAFNRRYELLLRGYFPDLDAAECAP